MDVLGGDRISGTASKGHLTAVSSIKDVSLDSGCVL
jgi:hypothetical protein